MGELHRKPSSTSMEENKYVTLDCRSGVIYNAFTLKEFF